MYGGVGIAGASLAFVAIISHSFKWRARVGDEIGVGAGPNDPTRYTCGACCVCCLDFDLPLLLILQLRALFSFVFWNERSGCCVFDLSSLRVVSSRGFNRETL